MKNSGQNLKPLRTTVHEVSAHAATKHILYTPIYQRYALITNSARILGQSMGARNRVETELS
jgi:hypothetical protein